MRTRPVTRGYGDVATLSLCTSQQSHSYVSTDTHNEVLMEHHQDISVVRLHNIILERRHNASRGRNNVLSARLHDVSKQVINEIPIGVSVVSHQDVSVARIHHVPLVRLYDVSCKSQIKQQIMLLWYVSTTSRSYVVATPYLQVSTTFSNYLVMTSIWQDSTFHLSIKSNINFFQYQTRLKQEEQFGLLTSRSFITLKNGYVHQQYSQHLLRRYVHVLVKLSLA